MRFARLAALIALFAGAPSVAPASTLFYNPVAAYIGSGGTTSGIGYTASIGLYNASQANQAAPVSITSFANGATSPRLVDSYSASSEAGISNNPGITNAAAQGQQYGGTAYAFIAGYDAANNTGSVSTTASASRSVGYVILSNNTVANPTVAATQPYSSIYTANNIRGAAGDDTATQFYAAGTGSPTTTAGWRNFNTNAQLSAAVTNVRTVALMGGKLYGTTGSGSSVGVYSIDPIALTATPFITTGTSSDHSPYAFALFNDLSNTSSLNGYNVAYIADDKSPTGDTNGGIEKWVFNGTSWSQAYILQDTATTYYRGLAGEMDPTTGLFTLFASTSDGTKLQQVTDNGAGSPFTTLATAATGYAFRGVALAPAVVPEPGTFALLAAGAAVAAFGIRRRLCS